MDKVKKKRHLNEFKFLIKKNSFNPMTSKRG